MTHNVNPRPVPLLSAQWPTQMKGIPDTVIGNAQRELKAGIDSCIYVNDRQAEKALQNAVRAFRDTFPRLSLWERFKDFFNLSESAENQRSVTAIVLIGMFNKNYPVGSEERGVGTRALMSAMQNVGLIRQQPDSISLETLTAETIACLLNRNPTLLATNGITLSDVHIAPVPDQDGVISLTGQVHFDASEEDFPDCAQDLKFSAPLDENFFCDSKDSSDFVDFGNIIGVIDERNTQEFVFYSLFSASDKQQQMQVEMQSCCLREQSGQKLFSDSGVFAGMNQISPKLTQGIIHFVRSVDSEFIRDNQQSLTESGVSRSVNSWNSIASEYNDAKVGMCFDTKEAIAQNAAFGLNVSSCPCHHDKSATFSVDREVMADLRRYEFSNTELIINGRSLPSDVIRRMQDAVPIDDDSNSKFVLETVCDSWASILQMSQGMDSVKSKMCATSMAYTFYQGGAGGFIGMLAGLGPDRDSGCQAGLTIVRIDTQQDASTSVTMAGINTGSLVQMGRKPAGTDVRVGGITFELPYSDDWSMAENTVNYTKDDVNVEGFGRRYPNIKSALAVLNPASVL